MSDDVDRLVEQWIRTFREPPPLVDPELMRLVLDEHQGKEPAA